MALEIASPQKFFADPADALLADVAIRVQLSRTDYNKAVSRYGTINDWIERDGSVLKDRVELFYPQGSMAIGATIASKLRSDEFDIDVIAQLDLPFNVLPREPLDLLYEAIRGARGSRYHGMTKRRTRCVTVGYSDGMHIDVSPALRIRGMPERQSLLFHQRPETPGDPGYALVANSYGFAEWFKANTPPDHAFAGIFEERAREYEYLTILDKADTDPVPSQEPLFQKSKAVAVLQLLKRWRNVQYDARQGRRPPSIMIAKLVADAANHTDRLSEELLLQARHLLTDFRRVHEQGRLVHVVNPVCEVDLLTDRWPQSLQAQALFIRDLEDLEGKAGRLVAGCDLAEMQQIMASLFGETPAKDAVRAFNERIGGAIGGGRSRYDALKGRLVVPAAAAASSAPAIARATPRHTFYGTERRG